MLNGNKNIGRIRFNGAGGVTFLAGVRVVPALPKPERPNAEKPEGSNRFASKSDLGLGRKVPTTDGPSPNPPVSRC